MTRGEGEEESRTGKRHPQGSLASGPLKHVTGNVDESLRPGIVRLGDVPAGKADVELEFQQGLPRLSVR